MKKLIAILLIAEVFIAYFVFTPTCVLRTELIVAMHAWNQNPTTQTRAELDRQSRISGFQHLICPVIAFGIMAAGTGVAARVWKRRYSA